MAMFDVIRFDGLKNRDWLIYKYPSEKIVLGSQLIVQEGQNAIFVKNGIMITPQQLETIKSLANENQCSTSHIISNMIDRINENEIYKSETRKASALIQIINLVNQIDGSLGDQLKRLVGEL